MPVRIILVAALATALLSACGLAPTRWEPPPEVHRAAALAAQGRVEEAAALYWASAQRAPRAEAFDLRLRAIETLLTPETSARAEDYLGRIEREGLSANQRLRLQLAEARLALLRNAPDQALEHLPAHPPPDVAPALAAQALDLRAQALAAMGRLREAVETRLELSRQAGTAARAQANEDTMWALLLRLSPEQLEDCRRQVLDPILAGWCELAWIASRATDETTLAAQIEGWRRRHAAHPAAQRFPQRILSEWRALRVEARKVAVLLPLSGHLAGPGRAIADGLLSAYYARSGGEELRFYDTAGDPSRAVQTYSEALAEGADAVIGPLLKPEVKRLAAQARVDVPTLTLNYLPDPKAQTPQNLYQFGLLPEDEVREIARRMWHEGKRRAIGFVAEGAWGERMLRALETALQGDGGRLLDSARLAAGQTDFSDIIQRALLLDESRARYNRLRAVLRREIRFEPRRRQDVEVIALAAPPVQARLLQPQLRFYFVSDLPVYATSRVYTGRPNPFADADLDGVEFCDAPLVLGSTEAARTARQIMEKTIGQSLRRRPRLVALGYDAWTVLPELRLLEMRPGESRTGLTGRLSIPSDRRLARALDWARFEHGRPVPVGHAAGQAASDAGESGVRTRLLPVTPGTPLSEPPALEPIPMGTPPRPSDPGGASP